MLIETIIVLVFGSAIADISPIVQTNNGKIRGETMKTYRHNNFYVFRGIPYAAPPVGALRFQPPQPVKNWNGILDSQDSNKICIQFPDSNVRPGESEDCLYLNVYTPKLPNEHDNVSLPVLVFIHGGAFVFGDNGMGFSRPYALMDTDIVMVVPQYRLGVLGFLSTGDLECPGNNGFKDQQFALRWVQANIHHFGGDPTKVTISGQSAGAASIGYQLLGSNAEGLFRGAIQASGSSLGAWTLQRDPRGYAYQIAGLINPAINESNTTTKELMSFFRTVDTFQLKKANVEMFGEFLVSFFNTFKGFVFAGVIEPEHDGAFLTETAFKKFETGEFNVVPTLIGFTSEESRAFLSDSEEFKEILEDYDTSPELFVTPDLHIIDNDVKREVGKKIRRFYVGDGLLHKNIGFSMRLVSDGGFGRSSIKQAQLSANYTDVYFYEFAYNGRLAHPSRPVEYIPGAEYVVHGDDLMYLFCVDRETVKSFPEMDSVTVDRLLLIWSNFVKYLNPTPEPSDVLQNVIWPKLSSNKFPYLLINETVEVKYDLKKPMMDEFERIYEEYAVPPLDTY